VERFDSGADNPFQHGPFHFQVLRDGPRLIHREWCQDAAGKVVAEQQEEVAYAVGSGTQARSYFVRRDGFLFESPITWYARKSAWHLSPSYEVKPFHFQRRIEPRCLYCHAQETHPIRDTVNHYAEPPFGQLAIGCERCHGPGERHVAARRQGPPEGDVDDTIVNPARLEPALREAVCEQCHLQGEEIVPRRGRLQTDYRPGLPLQEYVSIFVRFPGAEDEKRIVNHVEQMHRSACFTKSGGEFGCTSCHDPHRAPSADEKAAFYQRRCRNCHGGAEAPAGQRRVSAPDCSLSPKERNTPEARGNCLVCHMPRNPSSVAGHLAVTDHRLLRRTDQVRPRGPVPNPAALPLVPFHPSRSEGGDEELSRDLAVAVIPLADQAWSAGGRPVADYLTGRALPLLDRAVLRAPDDVAALEARGFALFVQGRPDDALKALESALALAPDREQSLAWAVEVAVGRDRLDRAEAYARRLTEKYPHFALHQEQLAYVRVQKKAWPQALEAARSAVRLDPFRPEARGLLIEALLETGDRAQAQAEMDVLGVIDPSYQEKLRPKVAGRLGRKDR
jgi:hypothetical protein